MLARFLQTCGAVALSMLIVFLAWLGHGEFRNVERHDATGAQDVLMVLRRGGISTEQKIEVVSSAESARDITGDHLDSYCIQLSAFDVTAMERDSWRVPVEFDAPFAAALDRAYLDGDGARCLQIPSLKAISDIKANVHAAYFSKGQVSAYRILFFDPATRRLLYVSYKS